ncbi:hypothetical protein [Nocardiopsis chromatogenes]|uniref:hypothetical protein n=1 Tax=Nocardiopsis chromatogenes TaxID=280239 RepID=UPI000347E270|nr:hypothetical protein [Nocardiopsis chromatogenes]
MSSSDPSGATPRAAATGGRRRRNGGGDPGEGAADAPRRRSGGSRRKPDSADGADGGGKGTRRGKALPILLGALGVAVVALVGVLVWNFMGGGAQAPAQARPTTYSVYDSDKFIEVLPSQEVDSRPLTEGEMFERGNEEIDSQDIVFELQATSLTEDCSKAVWGSKVQKALDDAGCTQAASAAYDSGDYVGAAVLFNLRDAEASQAVADAMEQPLITDEDEESPGFILNPGTEDPLTRLGTGFSRAEASVSGHYLLVAWAQNKSSQDPSEREDLTAPLIALSGYQDPLYRRVVNQERPGLETDQGAGAGSGTGTGAESGQGTGAEQGTGQGAGTGAGGAGQGAGTGTEQGATGTG